MTRRSAVVAVACLLALLAAAPAQAKNESVGIFHPDGNWQLINRLAEGTVTDYRFTFGMSGDVPVSGDWDGDGIDGPGVFRIVNGIGTWFLVNRAPASGIPSSNVIISFGMAGDKPFAGDFNRDGKDDIGVFRVWNGGANSGWFIHLTGNPGSASDIIVANWGGSPEDVPVAGDWDNDGRDGIGFFRNGKWYLLNSPANGQNNPPPDAITYFGDTGDQPIAGDWDGDGKDTFGVFRASDNGTWYLTNGNTGYLPNDITFSYWGGPGDKPIAGDWDGRKPECRDGVDNDHDGFLDWQGADVGCWNAYDTPEDVVLQTEAQGQVQVWNQNTHRMDTVGIPDPDPDDPMRTDWHQFVSYITNGTRVANSPDIVTLQETGTDANGVATTNCDKYVLYLHQKAGWNYDCAQTGKTGGAAIVYNTDRFAPDSPPQPVLLKRVVNEQNQAQGEQLGDCLYKGGWYALTLRLHDKQDPTKYVNVESVHLPPVDYDDPTTGNKDCTWDNMKIASPAVTGSPAQMYVMAGDWNHIDATATNSESTWSYWECAYRGMNVTLGDACGGTNFGWKDAMYQQCQYLRTCSCPAPTNDPEVFTCLHNSHWSFIKSGNNRRIDFLFAKASSISKQITVPWPDAYAASGGTSTVTQYSDHRGQGSLLAY